MKLITEEISNVQVVTEAYTKGGRKCKRLCIEGTFLQAEIKNRNGRMYPLGTLSTVSYTHLRAHETVLDLVCRLLLEKKK